MTNRKGSRPHIFKHAASGRWLEHWIDGWHLTDNIISATRHLDEQATTTKILPMLNKLFRAPIEVVFLDTY
ncbi:hypothetical protein A2482_03070 [Candidatus Falkowbacteria bacterium RIFOXYC2_FULL_48_21]|uniref:Uncharacterized protein n=1 Tax=Candidatus Falkowbacteria bacterium RIFOXYC2_FULL_48_21 TaxID=1798005 RepID=A0A1F5T813_9BACT|nr:MAG: hypothetical protein A2482_03070 [Candidatus Falkowbacteria bacterium RIFOXYC2_FULL_48_21]